MKSKLISLILVFTFLFSIIRPDLVLAQQALGEKKTFLAVMEIENTGGLSKAESSLLADTIRQEIFATGKYRIVDRKNMDQILKEQGFQLSDCTSQECAVQVGQLLGVEKMVVGSVGKVGESFVLGLQLISVETGEMESITTDKCPCPVDRLVERFKFMTRQLCASFEARKPALLAVSVSVDGAVMELNGKSLGKSPLKPQSLAAGKYRIKVSKEEYTVWEKQVELRGGTRQDILVTLSKAKPWYKKAWVWAVIGGVLIAGGGAGAYAAVSSQPTKGGIDVYY